MLWEVEDGFIFHLIFHSVNPLWINELGSKKWKVEDETAKKIFTCSHKSLSKILFDSTRYLRRSSNACLHWLL